MNQVYGAIPFPRGEEKCLARGQRLTDRMMDYLAHAIQKATGNNKIHIVPSFITVGLETIPREEYAVYSKVLMIMHQHDHWFLLVYDPPSDIFHLMDTVESEDQSPIDLELLPIGDKDLIEDYYGNIPHQGASATNCGILTLLNIARILADRPLAYDGSPARINGVLRPYLASVLTDLSKLDLAVLLEDSSST